MSDTGPVCLKLHGICSTKPVTAVPTHTHAGHVGGHHGLSQWMRFNLRDQVSERIIAGGHRLEAALSAGRNEQPGNTDGHRVALDVAGVDSDDVLARFP